MKTPENFATRLAEMVAAIEDELGAFDKRWAADATTSTSSEEYWVEREVMKRRLASCIEQHGGRAADRWDGARISFAGITVTCTSGLVQCARNWCRKARATMGETKP